MDGRAKKKRLRSAVGEARRGFLARSLRVALAVGPLVAFGAAYAFLPGLREEVNRVANLLLMENYDAVRSYVLSFGVWAPLLSLALMVLQAVISPIPAFALSIANGLIFGAFWGAVISLLGRGLAASLCFYLARILGRGPVETLVGEKNVRRSDAWLERWGTQAVLLTRLIPFFSFDLVSYAAGLSRIRFGRFLLATMVGEIPAVAIYAWAGAQAPDYIWLLLLINGAIFVATVAVGLFLNHRGRRA